VHAEGVAAEALRLEHPVKAGLGELGVQLGGVMADPLGLVGLRAYLGNQRLGAGDYRLRR
jgi:hypothetical protein